MFQVPSGTMFFYRAAVSVCYFLFDLFTLVWYRPDKVPHLKLNVRLYRSFRILMEDETCNIYWKVDTSVWRLLLLLYPVPLFCTIDAYTVPNPYTAMHYKTGYSCARDYLSMSRHLMDLTWFDSLGQSKQSNKPLYYIQSNYTVKV